MAGLGGYLAVFAGAGFGGVARYAVGLAVVRHYNGPFPLATFLINVSGCCAAGLIAGLLAQRTPPPHDHWRLLLVVGVMGGYTTFSTFGVETYRAIRDGYLAIAAANAVGSVLAGVAAAALGAAAARRGF